MLQTNNPQIIEESSLYELALSIGVSSDLKENCQSYLGKLFSIFDLSYVGLWLRKFQQRSYSEYFRLPAYQSDLSINGFFERDLLPLLTSDNKALIQKGEKSYLFFQVHENAIILLIREGEAFSVENKNELSRLMDKFGRFIKHLPSPTEAPLSVSSDSQNELRFTQSDYAVLFRHMVDGIFIYNYISEKILDCNEAAVKLFGFECKEDLIGLSRFDIIPNSSSFFPGVDFREYVRNHGVQVRQKEVIRSPGIFRKKDGGDLLADVNIIPTFQNDGEAFVIFHDTTNRVLDRKALKKAQKMLEERNEELKKYIDSNLQLENFAYMASHDLKTPIRSIVSFTQLLERNLKERLSEEEKEFIQFIIDASRNMQDLIQALLTYARVNSTKQEIEGIEVLDLLKQINMELRPLVEEKEALIEVVNLPKMIYADRIKLGRLFQNLLTNSLKFTSADQKPTIKIACQEKENYWQFSVEDNGIGIEKADQDEIFLLFRRLHSSNEYEGAGIGLATCKKIVEQHQGEIWVESKFAEGAKFLFTISKGL